MAVAVAISKPNVKTIGMILMPMKVVMGPVLSKPKSCPEHFETAERDSSYEWKVQIERVC